MDGAGIGCAAGVPCVSRMVARVMVMACGRDHAGGKASCLFNWFRNLRVKRRRLMLIEDLRDMFGKVGWVREWAERGGGLEGEGEWLTGAGMRRAGRRETAPGRGLLAGEEEMGEREEGRREREAGDKA